MPLGKVISELAEPVIKAVAPSQPRSILSETINKLPDGAVYKGKSVINSLKNAAPKLAGKGIKDEELEFSGFTKAITDPEARYTKADLQAIDAAREDKFGKVILNGGDVEFDDIVLSRLGDPKKYEEVIHTFSNPKRDAIVGRQVKSHFSERSPDYRSSTRRTIANLDAEDGRIVLELQSDLNLNRKKFGTTKEESTAIGAKSDLELDRLEALDAANLTTEQSEALTKNLAGEEVKLFETDLAARGKEFALSRIIGRQISRQTEINFNSKVNARVIADTQERLGTDIADAGSTQPKAPFLETSVTKDLESELADAHTSNLKFVAVPLEVGSEGLNRSTSVQKSYETTVRNSMGKLVKAQNIQIKQGNPDAKPEELFTYSEVKLNPKRKKLSATELERNNTTVITDTLEDLIDSGKNTGLFTEFLTKEELGIGANLTFDFLAKRMKEVLTDEEIVSRFNKLQPVDVEEHTLGKISLPKTPIVGASGIPLWMNNLSLYAAAPAGLGIAEIDQAMRLEGVTEENVRDHLVNGQGYDADEVNEMIAQNISGKVESLAELGLSPEEILHEMTAVGYKAEDLTKYIPSDSIMKDAYNYAGDVTKSILQFVDILAEELSPFGNYESEATKEINSLSSLMTILNSPETRAKRAKLVEEFKKQGFNQGLAEFNADNKIKEGIVTAKEKRDAQAEESATILTRALTVVSDAATPEDLEDRRLQRFAAAASSANEGLRQIVGEALAPWSTDIAVKMKWHRKTINANIVEQLTNAGIQIQEGERGQLMVPDSNGTLIPLDIGILDQIIAGKAEIFGSIAGFAAGAKAGAKVPVKHPLVKTGVVAVSSAVGGFIGSGGGRGGDILRHRFALGQAIDNKFLMDEMVTAGVADVVFGVIGAGLLKAGSVTIQGVYKSYDHVLGGNTVGASKKLLEVLRISQDQADEIIADWSRLPGNVAKGLTQAQRNIDVLPKLQEAGVPLVKEAVNTNLDAGLRLTGDLDVRAKQIKTKVNITLPDQIGRILQEDLVEYRGLVKQTFEDVKVSGVAQAKDSGYTFDFDELIDIKALDAVTDKLTNGVMKEPLVNYLNRIKALGDPDAPPREFSNLIELRKLLNQFGSKRVITDAKDIANIAAIRKNIDNQIASVARNHMAEGGEWLKQWKAANRGYKNMIEIETNTLVKAIEKDTQQDKAVIKKLIDSASAFDGTYREVLQALPAQARINVEKSVMDELITKYTKGSEGSQTLDFAELSKHLETIPFSNLESQNNKRVIKEFAQIYKTDPHLGAVTGNVHQSTIGLAFTDPQARAKQGILTSVYAYIARTLPSSEGNRLALTRAIGKAIAKPSDTVAFDDVLKLLPPNPELHNALKVQLNTIAKLDEKSVFPNTEIYRGSDKSGTGELGEGTYYATSKRAGKAGAKGTRVTSTVVNPNRIADEFMIKQILGLPENAVVTPKIVKDNRELLEQRMREMQIKGILLNDSVVIF